MIEGLNVLVKIVQPVTIKTTTWERLEFRSCVIYITPFLKSTVEQKSGLLQYLTLAKILDFSPKIYESMTNYNHLIFPLLHCVWYVSGCSSWPWILLFFYSKYYMHDKVSITWSIKVRKILHQIAFYVNFL